MNRFLTMVIVVLLLLSASWANVAATGTVQGSVTLNGAAVAGASVVVSSSGDSSYTAKATTDASGNFSVASAPVGTVEVKAYDSQGNFLAGGSGNLAQAGDVLSLTLAATR